MSLIIHHINERGTYLLEPFYLATNSNRHHVEFLQARGGLDNTEDDADSRRIAGSEFVFTEERDSEKDVNGKSATWLNYNQPVPTTISALPSIRTSQLSQTAPGHRNVFPSPNSGSSIFMKSSR